MSSHETLAEQAYHRRASQLRGTLNKSGLSEPEIESLITGLLRVYRPWPPWVIHIAVELLSVYFPKIRRQLFRSVFELVHWLFFEASVDEIMDERRPVPPEAKAWLDQIFSDPETDVANFFGHLEPIFQMLAASFDNRIKQINTEKWDAASLCRLEDLRKEMRQLAEQKGEALLDYLAAKPAEKRFSIMETAVRAKAGTYSKQGHLRDTPATHLYEIILENWLKVEEMSGPTELCEYLDPVLGAGTPEQKYNRVTHLMRRVGMKLPAPLSRDKPGG